MVLIAPVLIHPPITQWNATGNRQRFVGMGLLRCLQRGVTEASISSALQRCRCSFVLRFEPGLRARILGILEVGEIVLGHSSFLALCCAVGGTIITSRRGN